MYASYTIRQRTDSAAYLWGEPYCANQDREARVELLAKHSQFYNDLWFMKTHIA